MHRHLLALLKGWVFGFLASSVFFSHLTLALIFSVFISFINVLQEKSFNHQKSQDKITKIFLIFLETMETNLDSGQTISQAFVSTRDDFTNKQVSFYEGLTTLIEEYDNGEPLEVVLKSFSVKLENIHMIDFAWVFSTVHDSIDDMALLFSDFARMLREEQKIRDEISTMTNAVRRNGNSMIFLSLGVLLLLTSVQMVPSMIGQIIGRDISLYDNAYMISTLISPIYTTIGNIISVGLFVAYLACVWFIRQKSNRIYTR